MISIYEKDKLLNIPVPIFINDTIEIIKRKIFTLSEFLEPDYQSLFVIKNKNKIYLDDTKYLYEYGYDVKKIFLENYLSMLREGFMLQEVRKKWPKIKDDEYIIINRNKFEPSQGNTMLYNSLMKQKKIESKKEYENYKNENEIKTRFNNNIMPMNNGVPVYNIKSITIEYKLENPIDEEKLFKHIELDNEIPVSIYRPDKKKDAIVKIFDDIKNKINKDRLENWLLRETTKKTTKQKFIIKSNRGVSFKIKMSDMIYTDININKNSMTVKCNWNNGDFNDNCSRIISLFGQKIKTIVDNFKIQDTIIKTINSEIILNKVINKTDFKVKVTPYKNFFQIDPREEGIGLNYIRSKNNIKIYLDFEKEFTKLTITNATSEEEIKNVLLFSSNLVDYTKGTIGEGDVQTKLDKLKEKGATVDSISCQKKRQPVIDDNVSPQQDSYELIYKNNRYICNKPEYKYPGFTVKGAVCCFTSDQRQKKNFQLKMTPETVIRNYNPSNIPVNIKGEYHMALKKNSDYYYIKNSKPVKIEDKQIIDKLSKLEDVWLNPVSLQQLITVPQKSKCKTLPNFNDENKCNQEYPYFGYTKKGFPCCFNKKPKETVELKNKTKSSHTITTNKILDNNRIGLLPEPINLIFNESYRRQGVNQTNSSFLSVILKALNINRVSIEERKKIAENISEKKYLQLNGISNVFSYNEYKEYLASNKWLDHKLTEEIVSHMYKINIIVLIYDDNESKISCKINRYDNDFNEKLPYVVVLKQNEAYELITKENTKLFQQNDIKKIIDIYDFSCKAIEPSDYPLTVSKVISKLPKDKLINYKQVINKNGSVNFLINDYIVPVKNTKPINKIKEVDNIKKQEAIKQRDFLNSLSTIKGLETYRVIGQVIKKNKVVALMIKSKLIVPVKTSPIIPDLEVVNNNYYDNINEILELNNKLQDERVVNVLKDAVKEEYINRIHFNISKYIVENNSIKKEIIEITNEKNKRVSKIKKLDSIIRPIVLEMISNKTSKNKTITKRRQCSKLTKELCDNYCIWDENTCKLVKELDKEDIILNVIQEILKNDNIIKDKISKDILSEDQFIKRNTEVILLNPNEVFGWINN